jgi:hypothetical protein
MKTERELSIERRARFEAAAKARDPKYVMPPDPYTDPNNRPAGLGPPNTYRSAADQHAFEQQIAVNARLAAAAKAAQ